MPDAAPPSANVPPNMAEPAITAAPATPAAPASLADLARLFLRMSVLAFGGPVAHIAMGQDEIVEKRRWLSRADYLDIVAATNLIPGPNSTETMIHVGYVKQGVAGAVLAGLCFILPAALITVAITALYVAGGALPAVNALLWGIQPVILAIIAVAGCRLAPTALKDRVLIGLAVVSLLALVFTDLPEVVVMIAGGLLYASVGLVRGGAAAAAALFIPAAGEWARGVPGRILQAAADAAAPAAAVVGAAVSAGDLFWYFLRIGAVLFGSGYVLVAYIQQDLVSTFGWLSARQLLDAVAIGQFTPGPVLTTATAVGYITAGVGGAAAATLGVFLPSFVLVILTAPLLPRMKKSAFLRRFLDGANAAVLAAMAAAVLALAGEALRPHGALSLAVGPISGVALVLFAFALFAQIRLKWNATWLVLIGAAFGLAASVV